MKKFFFGLLLSVIFSPALSAQTPNTPASLEIETLITTPAVPPKASASVARHIQTIEKWFTGAKFLTRTERRGEVLVVMIPTDELFAPNEDLLLPESLKRLDFFKKAITNPDSYRILVLGHTDDTGDEDYSDSLSSRRAENIQTYFEKIASDNNSKSNIYYHGYGSDKPLSPNNSLANRAKNRRIEVYLIPEQKTIDSARSGKL